jgi:flagellar biosynthesis/type III secretory pathway protein FliH
MQTMQEIEAAYAEWERKVRQEGIQQGRREGRREGVEEGRHGVIKTIELLCRALDIEITEQRRDHLAGQDIEQLVQFADELSRSRRWPSTSS